MTKYLHYDDTLNIYYHTSNNIPKFITLENKNINNLENIQNVKKKIQWSPDKQKHVDKTFRFNFNGTDETQKVKIIDDIPEDIISWFDTSKIVDMNNGEKISQWDDIIGDSNFSANGPVYLSNSFNELPTIHFDFNSEDNMKNTINVSQPFTIFAVIDMLNTNESRHWLNGSNEDIRLSMHSSNTSWDADYNSGGNWNGEKYVVTMQYNGDNTLLRANSSQQISGSNNSNLSTFNLGYDNEEMYISEIQVRDSVYDTSKLNNIENNLADKWNISFD